MPDSWSGFAIEDEQRDLIREFGIDRQDAASRLDLDCPGIETGHVKIRYYLIDVFRLEPQTDHSFARRIDRAGDEANLRTTNFHQCGLPVCRPGYRKAEILFV